MEGLQTVGSALLTLGLVAVAVALSLYERLDLEREIGIAVVRSFVQLAAIGYVIDFIFGLESIGAVALLLAGMVLFAAWTSARRARNVPRAFGVVALAVGVAAVATLGLLLALVASVGAVSSEVAQVMAERVRELAGTDYGISITGIAGPGGGTAEKPVGLVYIGVADENGVRAEKNLFNGLRGDVRLRSTQVALNLLRQSLLKEPEQA